MEDEGTPPAQAGFLQDETESPSYHRRRNSRPWSHTTLPPRTLYKEAPNFGLGQQNLHGEEADIVRLFDEHWYWQSTAAAQARPYIDAWQASKGLERQRSFRNSALRTSIAQGNNAGPSGKQGNGLQSNECSIHTAPSLRSTADGDSEPDINGSETRDREASTPVCNPEDVDSIGTWAQRVLFFPSKDAKGRDADAQERVREQERQKLDRDAESGVNEAVSPSRFKRSQSGLRRQESREEEEAAHAAWRWRFNRRWRHEQAKQLDPEFGMDGGDEDGWEDALGYLDACGPGVHLQIGRLSSDKRSNSLRSIGSGGMGVLFDDSLRDKTLGDESDTATNNVASKAKKVQELYQKQNEIEQQVKARWGDTKVSMAWAGSHIKAVDIDSYGQFPFILAKLVDNTKAHRLLVRGHHNSSPQELLKTLNAEVEAICAKRRLPMVKTHLLGTGTMEWSREKDHRINVSQGVMNKGSEAVKSKDDVVRIAGALTRSSLSGTTSVTINGDKLS